MGYQTPGFELAATDPELLATFRDLLARYPRIAIAGGPRTGKSTLADAATDRQVFHSDDFKRLGWGDDSAAMVKATHGLGRFVIEGVRVSSALRKGMTVDALVVLRGAKLEQTPGQVAMTKGIDTVLAELEHLGIPRFDLYARGAEKPAAGPVASPEPAVALMPAGIAIGAPVAMVGLGVDHGRAADGTYVGSDEAAHIVERDGVERRYARHSGSPLAPPFGPPCDTFKIAAPALSAMNTAPKPRRKAAHGRNSEFVQPGEELDLDALLGIG